MVQTTLLLLVVSIFALSLSEENRRSEVFNSDRPFSPFPGRWSGEQQIYGDDHAVVTQFPAVHCMESVFIKLRDAAKSVVSAHRIAGRKDGKFVWKEIGRFLAEGEESILPIVSDIEKSCFAHLKLVAENNTIDKVSFSSHVMPGHKKREFSQSAPSCLTPGEYPDICVSTGAGQKCVQRPGGTEARCSCQEDADCYGNPVFPFCVISSGGFGFCDFCTLQTTVTAQQVSGGIASETARRKNDFFCRKRFPSRYQFLDPSSSDYPQQSSFGTPAAPLGVDVVAANVPSTFFREFCTQATGNEGSCEACSVADDNVFDAPEGYFPVISQTLSGEAANENQISAVRGSYHCGRMYTSDRSVQGKSDYGARPVCNVQELWSAVGLDVNQIWIQSSITMEWSAGAEDGALTDNNITSHTESLFNFRGACIPCAFDPNTGDSDTRTFNFHGLCLITDRNAPICSAASGCSPCTSASDIDAANSLCGEALAQPGSGDPGTYTSCAQTGNNNSGFCTGGPNCYSEGFCGDCRTLGCSGTIDHGNQQVCNENTGICEDATPCTGESASASVFQQTSFSVGAELCSGTSTPNCFSNGECARCSASRPCTGDKDGADTICDIVTGICMPPCRGETDTPTNRVKASPSTGNQICGSNLNCMDTGLCVACTTAGGAGSCTNDIDSVDTVCVSDVCVQSAPCTGEDARGYFEQISFQAGSFQCTGTVEPNCFNTGACGRCTSSPQCSGDLNGADNTCNNGICQPACTGEVAPSGRSKGSGTGPYTCNAGDNCMSNGLCRPCTSQSDCTTNDPQGTAGTPDVECVSGICVQVAPCTGESQGRVPQQPSFQAGAVLCGVGENCFSGDCRPCTSNTDCNSDPQSSDRRCDAGICRPFCTGEATSFSTLNKNSASGAFPCPASGNTNCYTSGDCSPCSGGPASCNSDLSGDTVCLTSSGVCVIPCDGNADENTPQACPVSAGNCHNDGFCYNCNTNGGDQNCISSDGPPDQGSNTQCRSDGICRDPICYHNSDCPFTGGDPNARNCGYDGQCFSCVERGCGVGSGASFRDGPGPNIAGGTSIGIPDQPNCDAATHICVNYCTSDADCSNPCEPHCEVDRGCCVECTTDSDCPFNGTIDSDASPGSIGGPGDIYPGQPNYPDGFLLKWRGDNAAMSQCDQRLHHCRVPQQCDSDANCTAGTPACHPATKSCVGCVTDGHCTSAAAPACSTSRSTCVGCTADAHCPTGRFCLSSETCVDCYSDGHCGTGLTCRDFLCVDDEASASTFSSALLLAVGILFAKMF